MKTYNKPYAIIASLCAPNLYRDVCNRWQGMGFSYLLLLTTVMVTTLVFVGSVIVHDYLFKDSTDGHPNRLKQFAQSVAEQMPTMVWQKGQMELQYNTSADHLNKTPDIFIRIGNKDVHLVHIDPDATKESAEPIQAFAILTRDGALIRKSEGLQARSWESMKIDDGFTMNSDIAAKHGQHITNYIEENRQIIMGCLAMFIWAVSMLLLFIWRVLQALAFGLVVMMFGSFMNVTLSYHTSVRLAAVAITPAILIDAAVTLATGNRFPFLAFVMIATCYTAYAAHCNRSADTDTHEVQ